MAYAIATVISSCRILSGDGPSDNFMRAENLNSTDSGNVVDGAQTTFNVSNFPVVSIASIVADNRSVQPASITLGIGQFTLGTAPTTSIYASYYYQLFDDPTWTEFINSALEALNLATTGVPANDIVNIPNGLMAALKMYVSYYFCTRVSKQTGLWYNQRLQERVDDRDTISKKWMALADKELAKATAMRDDFYSGSGTKHGPSFAIVEHQPVPWTPGH